MTSGTIASPCAPLKGRSPSLLNQATDNSTIAGNETFTGETTTSQATPSLQSLLTDHPPTPHEVKAMLEETVNGLKDVASESYQRVRHGLGFRTHQKSSYASKHEWNTSGSVGGGDNTNSILLTSPGGGDGSRFDVQAHSERQRRAAARQALEDLMSPFFACHSGNHGGVDLGNDNSTTYTYKDGADDSIASPIDMSQLHQLREKFFQFASNRDDDTILSLNTQEEDEMMQLQRLTSWNTIGTVETNETADDSVRSAVTSPIIDDSNGQRVQITDDDGHVIPLALLETAQKRREKRRRNRIVRFEYPPISSLRECPRTNPDDIPDLFFTEEELDEIEADRHDLCMVDDVEIVAVETKVAPSSTAERDEAPGSSPRHRKPRSSSPHPQHRKGGGAGKSSPASSTMPTSGADDNDKPEDDARLLSGIQIYLRERSTGKAR